MIPIIGLCGKKRVGKDTAARLIMEERAKRSPDPTVAPITYGDYRPSPTLHQGGYQYSFADPIRWALNGMFREVPDWHHWIRDETKKEQTLPWIGKSYREMMQTLGTEWGRELVHSKLWLVLAEFKYANMGPGMVVADVRFENEARWIRAKQGLVVHITRGAAPTGDAHASEAGVKIQDDPDKGPVDYVIENDGDLKLLRDNIFMLLESQGG